MNLLVFVGSLREASFSRKMAKAVEAAAPKGTQVVLTDGGDVPLYNQDLDGEAKPASVQTLLDQVHAADAMVFVTPEFNYGIPGPLKNAIDWASRPAYRSPLRGTPAVVIAVSVAPVGGARAHTQLTSVLNGTLTPVYNGPAMTIGAIHEKFDEAGALTDETTVSRLDRTVGDLLTWAGSLAS